MPVVMVNLSTLTHRFLQLSLGETEITQANTRVLDQLDGMRKTFNGLQNG